MNYVQPGMYEPFFIVIPASLPGLLNEDELRFILGHEIGHIKLRHTHIAPSLGGGGWSGRGIAVVLGQVRCLILSTYQGAQEFRADGVGTVARGSAGPAFSALIRVNQGSPNGAVLDTSALAAQAVEVDRGSMALAGRLRQVGKSQPSPFYRPKELANWAGLPTEPSPGV
jgi:Zn-dependent protease with chaperone function